MSGAVRDATDVDQLFAPAARSKKSNPGSASPSPVKKAPQRQQTSSAAGVDEVSSKYRDSNVLGITDRVTDGFTDHCGDQVLVDRGNDERLDAFLVKGGNKLKKVSADIVTTLMAMALYVSEFCGRSGSHAADLGSRTEQRIKEARATNSGVVPLGILLGDQGKKRKLLGAGLARHRALVFKVLADALELVGCTLERDKTNQSLAWNTVQLDGASFVVDLMHDPGTLYEAGSPKQQEYFRLISAISTKAFDVTISRREELPGKVPRPAFHVEPSDIEIGTGEKDKLGKGGFGEVFGAYWADTKVAVKVVKDKDPTDYDILEFILEISLLSRLNHPNVMRFWRGCADMVGKRSLLMVTEYIEKGGLSGLLHGHGGTKLPEPFTRPQALWFGLGTGRGMQYLHSCKVLHLDLKSPNVLVEGDWTPKLCDFGLAKITSKETEAGLQTTLRGVSPIWAPPEMFDDRADGMTEKADVYSFGIVFFEIVGQKLPFQEITPAQLPRAKYDGVLPRMPKEISEDCANLILACCVAKPTSRPTMGGVVARIQDIADGQKIDLSEVQMPAWHSAHTAVAEKGAMRDLSLRVKGLTEEQNRLMRQFEQARERRRLLLEKHLGKTISTDDVTPLLQVNGSKQQAAGATPKSPAGGPRAAADGAKGVAPGADGTGARTEEPAPAKKCCALM